MIPIRGQQSILTQLRHLGPFRANSTTCNCLLQGPRQRIHHRHERNALLIWYYQTRHFSSTPLKRQNVSRVQGIQDTQAVLPTLEETLATTDIITTNLPFPLEICLNLITTMHDTFHLPFYLSIIGSTLLLRLVFTLPVAMIQHRRMERMNQVREMVQAWESTLTRSIAREAQVERLNFKNYQKRLSSAYKQKLKSLYKQYDCHPFTTFLLPWTQIPLFITMSLTMRYITAFPLPFLNTPAQALPGMETGGVGWFTDLTVPDDTFILPYIIGFGHYLNVEMNAFKMKLSPGSKVMQNLFRGLAVVSVAIAANVPTGVSMYWATSVIWSVAWNAWRVRQRLENRSGVGI